MTEKEKAQAGELYDACSDSELVRGRMDCRGRLYEYNRLHPSDTGALQQSMRRILGAAGQVFEIVQPFFCDYGYNIRIGENFFANTNCVILDAAQVTFGDNVFVGPNCGFYAAQHPTDAARRNRGLEWALPITVGNNVWIGAGVQVMPGVTIGDGAVIGGGSVVVKDIPANCVAVGNPCRVLRQISQ